MRPKPLDSNQYFIFWSFYAKTRLFTRYIARADIVIDCYCSIVITKRINNPLHALKHGRLIVLKIVTPCDIVKAKEMSEW